MQVEEAYKYVLSKINLSSNINGLYRYDQYELPTRSIREIIANATVHRSFLDTGNVQVAIYDDRLEITSPGMLLNGVTVQKMKEGYSKVRNKAIAKAFTYMRIIEQWGSGIPRIYQELHDMNLKEPKLIDMDGDFRVNLYRAIQLDSNKSNQSNQSINNYILDNLDEIDKLIIETVLNTPTISQSNISKMLNIKKSTIKYKMMRLKKLELLTYIGTTRKGYWKVNDILKSHH